MTEKVEKQIPLAKLPETDRERVLEMMIAGIHMEFDRFIKMKTRQAFLRSHNTGEPFDPGVLWASLPVGTQNHFEHARQATEKIWTMLDGDPPPLAPAPKKAEPKKPESKKSGKKKGR